MDVLDVTAVVDGSGLVTIDAEEIDDRIFDLFAGGLEGIVTLRGLLLRNGHPPGSGGGIYNRTVLFLEPTRVEDPGRDQRPWRRDLGQFRLADHPQQRHHRAQSLRR